MIYTALIISFASLGFRCITGKNMIFYFLRKWLDGISDEIKQAEYMVKRRCDEREKIRDRHPKEIDIDEMSRLIGRKQSVINY